MHGAELDTAAELIEVIVMWGESVLHVEHVSPPRAFWIGEPDDKHKPDFLIGSEMIGTGRLALVQTDAGRTALMLPPGATGEVTIDGQRFSFDDPAVRARMQPSHELSGALVYPLAAHQHACICVHGFTFHVQRTSAVQRVGVEAAHPDWKENRWTFGSLLLHVAVLILFQLLPPHSSALAIDLMHRDRAFIDYLVTRTETLPPPWVQPKVGATEAGSEGRAHAESEGSMGDEKAPKAPKRSGIRGPKDNPDPQMARDSGEQADPGLIGVLKQVAGNWQSPTSPFGATQALGRDPSDALGALLGDRVGTSFGFGGLGMKGPGRGGGGDGLGTAGLGKLTTIGMSGACNGEYCSGGIGSGMHAKLGGRKAKVPFATTKMVEVRGSLSKEVIRRVIHRRINEVRYCYEQELATRPELQGRVAIKFVIAASGAVQVAVVASSTVGNMRLEQCIAQAVRRFDFPVPDGGGIVAVTYPFVLQQTGS